jgi:hypothetical protein
LAEVGRIVNLEMTDAEFSEVANRGFVIFENIAFAKSSLLKSSCGINARALGMFRC